MESEKRKLYYKMFRGRYQGVEEMKLKTLKDIYGVSDFDCDEDEYLKRNLKAEAIKWVKVLDKTNKDNYDLPRGESVDIGDLKDVEVDWEESSEIYGMIKILKHFFNLTEEDLK